MKHLHLQKSKFHFVGIGGIGMSGLAELLHNMGAQVTGSDLSESVNTQRLEKLNILISYGHSFDHVGEVDVVVYSSAVRMDNPEIAAARAKRIPLIPRAEALAEIMRLRRGIAVAGTHGKTTTTSMLTSIFMQSDFNPTALIGGRFNPIGSTAVLGDGEWLLAEADESDDSFQKLSPEIAIVTNIDSDHLDHFKTFENLQSSFYQFALKIPFYGALVICGDDAETRLLFKSYPKRVVFYGLKEDNDFVVKGSNGKYDILVSGQHWCSFQIQVPGTHNALNAAASLIAATRAGIPLKFCLKGLSEYQGVDRRFQKKGEYKSIPIYDDYGHHPTEIRATLEAFKERYPNKRLVVLFQPHRYSRTQHCWHEFTTCFQLADQVILTDIYAAGELPLERISAVNLAKDLKHPNVHYYPRNEHLSERIKHHLHQGDVFTTLGAGDIWKIGMNLLDSKE